MVFAVVLLSLVTTVLVATVWLSTSIAKDERVQEDQVRVQYAVDAAAEQVAQDCTTGALPALPTSRTVSVNGVACSLTITDNSVNVPHTIGIASSATYHARTLSRTKIIGMRKTPSPFYYSLFVGGGLTYGGTLALGASGSNGDLYAGGNLTLTGSSSVLNGNVEATGSLSAGSATITGSSYPSTAAVALPSVNSANYSGVANQTVNKSSLAGATLSPTAGAYYLIYCGNSNVSISGTFTGKGTIFASGNVTISGPIVLGNSSSRVAIIANGNISFTSSGPHSAYFYGNGVTVPAGGITITKGALVCNSVSNSTAPISITNDTAVWLDATEGSKHRLPGFYP